MTRDIPKLQVGEMKVFVSYSHEDADYLDELKKHFAVLIDSNEIQLWDDQVLLAGDKLNPEIDAALEKADLFLFLVSASFLASYACIRKELEYALEKSEHQNVRLIAIVVRPCDWLSTRLANFLALPKDGQPITDWANRDSAYLHVVNEVRRLSREQTSDSGADTENKAISLQPSQSWSSYLESTEIAFSHSRKKEVLLSDVYVSPYLKPLSKIKDEIDYSEIERLVQNVPDNPYVFVLGGSQSGKTTLVKRAFVEALDNGYIPLVLNCHTINSTDVQKLARRAVREQYECNDPSMLLEQPDNRHIYLLDNFDQIRLNRRHQQTLIEILKQSASGIFVFANRNIEYAEPEYLNESAGFSVFLVRDFGHVKRSELIARWVQLGRKETIDEAIEIKEISQFERHVNGVIRKNIVPPKPLYVLSILQSLDAFTVNDYKLTSYGHCYNFLIQQALQNGSIKVDELDAYINLLTHLAYFLFSRELYIFRVSDLEAFLNEYEERFLRPEGAIESLIETRILRERDGEYTFSHKYIYYYYAGKYLAELLERGGGIREVEALCADMHLEQNANILIFITHHTKSSDVIEHIALYADECFPGRMPSKLDSEETRFLAERREKIPKLVLESRTVEDERRRRAENKDVLDDALDTEKNYRELEDDITFKDIVRSAKTVEIVGQIIRNRHGSLTRNELNELLQSAILSGLRFMNFFIEFIEDAEDELVDMISKAVSTSDKPLSPSQADNLAKSVYTRLCYGGVISIILKIASAIGHKKVLSLIRAIEKKYEGYVSIELVSIALELEFSSSIPRTKIEAIYKGISGNVVADRILKEIVVNHLYLNYIDRADKQWIASKLGIPLSTQNRIEGYRAQKKLPKT